jgi:hypothetical protein
VIWNIRDVEIVIPEKAGTDKCPGGDPGQWEEISTNEIRVPEAKDLSINVSLESEVSTNNRVKPDVPALSEALVEVKVRVLVDGVEADPGEVIFARRFQALVFKNAEMPRPEHIVVTANHMVSANSFTFVAEDVPRGTHDIVVETKIVACQVIGDECGMHPGTAVSLGNGTVTVECVEMIDDDDSDD